MSKEWKNWKSNSKKYLLELEKFLDKVESIKDEEIRKEIIFQVLKIDNELTTCAEKMFDMAYERGMKDAEAKRNFDG